jgi:FkbM family methyltransferase
MWRARFFGSLQRLTGRTPWMLRLAVLVRNQCQCAIGAAFTDGNTISDHGEEALIDALGTRTHVIIDVGANVGDWTAEILRRAPGCRAVLFDASQSAVTALRKRFPNENVEVAWMGLSDAPGELEFFEEPGAGKTSSFTSGFARPDAIRTTVRVSTVSQQVDERGIETVDVLKIDAEGYDMRVLRGATPLLAANRIGVVQFEYNEPWALAGGTLGEAVSLLRRCGYRVFALKSAGLFPFDYRRYGEFFRYSNFVAVSPAMLPLVNPLVRRSI